MEIKIVERNLTRIIGMKIETLLLDTREQRIIPKLQQSFNERLAEVHGAVGLPATYGIFIDPPNYNPNLDPFTWIAGVEVEADAKPPAGMVSYELPRGTYASFAYHGNIDQAGAAYDQLFQWIKESEYVQAGTFGFEMYTEVHTSCERERSEFLLHFPVRPRS
ncbi:GyrI-like domain-containing protein [Mesobacillus foraminis]|uniref:GyrI-like domain-containing protein n=1 Tax=Mesobacillus foraminis TaxID=279826 RepID=UPI001BE67BC7|nr:GyrI-like domain-containing protein [Mesobacillus foraminis]MBT2759174.1 GyrI-like domain-containing protein [Mesobacillus foraminis]